MADVQGMADGRTSTTRHPNRLLLVVAVLTLAVAGAACGPRVAAAPPCGPASPPDATADLVLTLANNDRAASGLPALAWHGQLWCLAASSSQRMASSASFTHHDLAGALRSSGYRTLGENILRGPSAYSGDQMHSAWMSSPTHQANILSGSFTSLGMAMTWGVDGQLYVSVIFGG